MTCQMLSDRMPGVAAGRSSWNAEEQRHLEACADCRAEWRLVAAGASLGRTVGVDGDRIAAWVLERLRTEPVSQRRGVPRSMWWVGAFAAAAAAVALLVNTGGKPSAVAPTAATEFTINLTELDSLSVEQLESVLESMESPFGEGSTLETPSLEELDDQQLERVLRAMEG